MLAPPGLDVSSSSLTTFTVKAAGQALGAEYGILSIEIRREVNRVPKATIVLIDGDAAAQTFAISEEDTLMPGVEVEILGGYSSEETTLFKGMITRHRIEVGRQGGSRLTLEMPRSGVPHDAWDGARAISPTSPIPTSSSRSIGAESGR